MINEMVSNFVSGIPFLGNSLSSSVGESLGIDSQLSDLKVKLFIYSLLVVIAFFFASAGLNTLFFYIQKKKVSYIQNMNILSAAMLPLAVCGASAMIMSFIYLPIPLFLFTIGIMFKYIMLYEGLKKVRNYFKRTYNDKFYTFLAGWVERQHYDNENAAEEKRIQVTSGIVAFFNNYHIDFNEKMIEARRKAWIRYLKKLENYKVSPAFN